MEQDVLTIDDLQRTINANRFWPRNAWHGQPASRLGNGEHKWGEHVLSKDAAKVNGVVRHRLARRRHS